GRVTSATRMPTSPPRERRSATSPPSSWKRGCAARSSSLASDDGPIRILRVIARLNMGGPALHVSYLSAGLRARGYETTLVAGNVGPGEQSMAYVAEEMGVPVVLMPHLHREISPIRDLLATFRLARMIRDQRPHIVHTHTAKAGAIGRFAAVLA